MKTFFYICLLLLPAVVFTAPADEGYQRDTRRSLEDMMKEFMPNLEKPKPTIAMEKVQTVKAEELGKKGIQVEKLAADEGYQRDTRGSLEDMMKEFMPNLEKPKPTIAMEKVQTVKAEELGKKGIQEMKLAGYYEALKKMKAALRWWNLCKMVDEIKREIRAEARN